MTLLIAEMSSLTRIFVFGCLALCLGCASKKLQPPLEQVQPSSKPTPAQPLSVSVSQEFNDGKRLYVKALVEAQTTWNTSDAVVRLTGFKDGDLVGEKIASLTDLGPVLQAGEKKEIPVILEAADITDYQIELLWGQDSKLFAAKDVDVGAVPRSLELRNLIISSERVNCHGMPPCDLKFTVAGELFNATETTVDHAVLGTGFVWGPGGALDLSAQVPENESRIELAGLGLGPGASRRVRLVLDSTVPEREDGAYKPVLRVISVNSASENGPETAASH